MSDRIGTCMTTLAAKRAHRRDRQRAQPCLWLREGVARRGSRTRDHLSQCQSGALCPPACRRAQEPDLCSLRPVSVPGQLEAVLRAHRRGLGPARFSCCIRSPSRRRKICVAGSPIARGRLCARHGRFRAIRSFAWRSSAEPLMTGADACSRSPLRRGKGRSRLQSHGPSQSRAGGFCSVRCRGAWADTHPRSMRFLRAR